MTNPYLVPEIVQNTINQLLRPDVGENERLALIQRIEAIRDACQKALDRDKNTQTFSSKSFYKQKK